MSRLVVTVMLLLAMNTAALGEVFRFTFNFEWDSGDVSSGLPSGAHFTQLVGATHIEGAPLWQPGGFASPGIENVAEEGNPATLITEVDAAILSGTAGAYFKIRGLFNPPTTRTKAFEVFADKPAITLISMIAPSPDWFVGVSDFSLLDQNSWISNIAIDLMPWDAGTEDGTTFTLSNPPTTPHEAIAMPVNSPFIGSPVVATLEIEHVTPNGDINENGTLDAGDLLLATQFLHEHVTPTLEQRARADIMPLDLQGNPVPDGLITVADVFMLQKLITGL